MIEDTKQTTDSDIQDILSLLESANKLFKRRSISISDQKYDSFNSLFLYYREVFLESYINLFNAIYKNKDDIFTEFSFRTLLEMGVEDSFIIFSNKVPEKEKRNYILLTILSEYGFSSMKSENFRKWFDEIFNENVNLLSPIQITQLHQYTKVLKTKTINRAYVKKLRDVRRLIFKKKKEIIDRLMLKDQDLFDIEVILSGHSHILHGNPILLKELFMKDKKDHISPLMLYLKISGFEMLKNVSEYLNNPNFRDKVDNLYINKNRPHKRGLFKW